MTRVCAIVILILLAACSPSPRYTTHRPPAGSAAGKPSSSGSAGQSIPATNEPVEKVPRGTKIRGVASYYGDEFNGRQTSNGETFDMYGLTCAHRTLPFNTWLEVKNLANGRTVIVRVNDRGPFKDGRILDLSYGAARELHMLDAGIQEVEITVIR